MFIIGLTGTIGSGKSAVADMLAGLGAEVIDTDVVARDVVEPGTRGFDLIVANWGKVVLNSEGRLDREALADIVFNDEAQRQKLNSLIHPLVIEQVGRMIKDSAARAVVLVVPLLFESGMHKMVQSVWVVSADEESLVERIRVRDGCDAEHAGARIRSQMKQDEKIALADVVIDNSGSLERTRGQVEEAWKKLEEL
ncbi:MAG TPA: dephospho-CoA kinase [bacterium]|nr:dephospho-CoA kinase [bacterium]